MTTFVLVHGAWHGGWCWRDVADRLRADGHLVYTPTLTGLADRSHLLTRETGLETHILDIVNLLDWEELDDVVLCGHSYGGMVVTGAADRAAGRLRALVYLDAFVPADGQCLHDMAPPERVAAFERSAAERGDGWKVPPLPASAWLDDPAQQARVEPKVTPHPLRCLTDRIELSGAWEAVGRRMHILAAANDPSPFHAIHERVAAEAGWLCRRIDGPHDLMISHPDETAALLLEAAGIPTLDKARRLRGSGWEGDLDRMRSGPDRP